MSELEALPPELEELANEVGDFICYWGFKKIHGRIWTHIYLSQMPLDAGQLMQRLKVSKALISLSINDLLKYNVILESDKSSRGTQTYISNPDVLDVILNVLRRRESEMLGRARHTHGVLTTLSPESLERAGLNVERIEGMGRMIREAQNALNSLLELATLDMAVWGEINEGKRSRQ